MVGRSREGQKFIELLFRQNYNRIYEYCFWKLERRQDAEDCAMETFLRAADKAAVLAAHPCPERWLYVTARNVSMEIIKKQARFVRLERETEASVRTEEELFHSVHELEEWLTGCLKPEEQELYRLLVKEEEGTAQIAERLSISYTNAATRIYRLRKKLKKQLSLAEGKEEP